MKKHFQNSSFVQDITICAGVPRVDVKMQNVVLTAVKKAEEDSALILRFYEWAGKKGDVKLQLPAGAKTAAETDLMERPIGDLVVLNGAVTVHSKRYEIKTVKVRFASKPGEKQFVNSSLFSQNPTPG